MMRNKKRKKGRKYKKLRVAAGILGGFFLAVLLFLGVFRVRHIQVTGNTRYSEEEIKKMALQDPLMFNSVLLTVFHPNVDQSSIPFLESFSYEYVSNDTICVNVSEKKAVGYLEFEGQKIYFDKNGVVLECIGEKQQDDTETEDGALKSEPVSGSLSSDPISSARVTVSEFHPALDHVPLVTGLTVSSVRENEVLPVSNPSVFRTILALTRMIEKYQIYPDSVEFQEDQSMILHYYGTVRVSLGKDSDLEEKMTRTAAILPSLQGMSGILHMEDYSEQTDSFVFTKDEEPAAEEPVGGEGEKSEETEGEE